MNDWSEGYVSDVGYTFGYYKELNPLLAKLAFLNAGIVAPEVAVACELGFGQGISVNMHASGSGAQWHGTDFNPEQAGFAKELAEISKSSANLCDDSFAEFANRTDLPEFDYIGLHGIWSWISDENRSIIVDFIRRKLKVGGVLYISYNTLPGWAGFAPMRHLFLEHADKMGARGEGSVGQLKEALSFTDKFVESKPAYVQAIPHVAPRLAKIKEQNPNYLVHEYFNRDWKPMYFSEMADWLSPTKLTYACSTHLLDSIDILNLTNEQQAVLNDIPDPMFRQSVRDYMVSQQFRRDYWVKGARQLTALEQAEGLRALKVILTVPRANVSLKISGALGEGEMSSEIYGPILDFLADHKIYTIAQIEQKIQDKNINFSQLLQAILVLVSAGSLALAQDFEVIKRAKKQTDKLNAQLMVKARLSNDISYLASPVTGGGIAVTRFKQLFLMARNAGKKKPEEWVTFVWQILSLQGQKLLKDGKTLEDESDNIAVLTAQANEFVENDLPVLIALQIG